MRYIDLKKIVHQHSNKSQAIFLQRFFKTAPGQYAEGDIFAGIKVPVQRMIAKQFTDLSLDETQKALQSKIHEERLIALFILVIKFKKAEETEREKIIDLYLNNLNHVNNWDLVDLSAPKLLGEWLLDKDREILFKLANSKNLWDRRISMLSTFRFIQCGEFVTTLRLSKILLNDKHDLIHKAVGWMLREIGKKDLQSEEDFLEVHYQKMPRTMLRYAIEKFPEPKRKAYLLGKVKSSHLLF
jgi:3-methyladenine DNA glycosylase AlkD